MIKLALGLFVGVAVGAVCRIFAIPSPSPPSFIGALLVCAMTLGYLAADWFFQHRANTTRNLCGGPSGKTTTTKKRKDS